MKIFYPVFGFFLFVFSSGATLSKTLPDGVRSEIQSKIKDAMDSAYTEASSSLDTAVKGMKEKISGVQQQIEAMNSQYSQTIAQGQMGIVPTDISSMSSGIGSGR